MLLSLPAFLSCCFPPEASANGLPENEPRQRGKNLSVLERFPRGLCALRTRSTSHCYSDDGGGASECKHASLEADWHARGKGPSPGTLALENAARAPAARRLMESLRPCFIGLVGLAAGGAAPRKSLSFSQLLSSICRAARGSY